MDSDKYNSTEIIQDAEPRYLTKVISLCLSIN